jgi:fructan beta-fructosidase
MKWIIFISCLFVVVLSAMASEDIVIADFEDKNFGQWKIEGNAFGERPAWDTLEDQMEVSGWEGYCYVNSFHGGDNSRGTLTSHQFIIERDYINFLIGGGGFKGETCMNLLVGDQVARSATGSNTEPGGSEVLDWKSWDVKDLKGKTVQIQIVDNRSGDWGHILVDHIVQSDQKVELVENAIRQFTFNKKYLNLPVKRGASQRLMHVLIEDQLVREFQIRLAPEKPDFWVYLELDQFQGKNGTLKINKLNKNKRRGFDAIFQADTFPGEDSLYQEKHRPQFHFSSKRGWNNDPNGLMYYGGEYHMFYQHNPFGWPWGNMTWGHAISTDLVHWKELGDALYPDELGTMFSGSGVVDWKNTTGLQTADDPPLITIFTNAGDTNPWSRGKPFTQGIAYSNDRGRTWTKYEGNPVQGHLNDGNRDPKVIWWEETQEWVIVLYLKKSRMAFFRSKDLKRWELQSILQSFHECPELFQLPLDGDESNKKWILYGAAGDYFIGDFDGSQYKPESEVIKYNYGDAFYASQTFSDIPKEDGRRIQIGWGQCPTPGMPFNQMMNFPVVLTLRTTDQGIRMCANPVKEIELLYVKRHTLEDENLDADSNPLSKITGDLFEIKAEFDVRKASQIGFEIRGVPVVYDAEQKIITCKEEKSPCKPKDGKIKLHLLVDRTSIEIFINDGEYFMPIASIPDDDNKSLKVYANGGEAKIISLEVNELKSIWE